MPDPREQPPGNPPQFRQYGQQQQPYQQPQQPQPDPWGDGGARNGGYGQPPGPQYPPPQPQWQQPYRPPSAPPPRQRHKGLKIFAAVCGGIFLLGIVIAAVSPSTPAPAPSATATAAAGQPTAAPVAAKAATVAKFSGSGAEKTARFTVTGTWKLVYSFDCSSFGYKGNFQVFEDGGSDFSGVTVNDLAMSKSSSTYAYGDAGTHYLEVNSECAWTLKVVDEG